MGEQDEGTFNKSSNVPVGKSSNVPVGKWVEVPKGFSVVEGCYVDSQGHMRFADNDALAVWHHSSKCPNHQPPCSTRVLQVSQIVYDQNGAPWCGDCISWTAEDEEIKKQKQFEEDVEKGLKSLFKGD